MKKNYKTNSDELYHFIEISKEWLKGRHQKVEFERQLVFNLNALVNAIKQAICEFPRIDKASIMAIQDSRSIPFYFQNYWGHDEGLIALKRVYEIIENHNSTVKDYEDAMAAFTKFKIILEEERQHWQKSKAGKSDKGAKKSTGIKEAIREHLESESYKPEELWGHLKDMHTKDNKLQIGNYLIYWVPATDTYEIELKNGERINPGMLIQESDTSDRIKPISYGTFKKLFYEVMKLLR